MTVLGANLVLRRHKLLLRPFFFWLETVPPREGQVPGHLFSPTFWPAHTVVSVGGILSARPLFHQPWSIHQFGTRLPSRGSNVRPTMCETAILSRHPNPPQSFSNKGQKDTSIKFQDQHKMNSWYTYFNILVPLENRSSQARRGLAIIIQRQNNIMNLRHKSQLKDKSKHLEIMHISRDPLTIPQSQQKQKRHLWTSVP